MDTIRQLVEVASYGLLLCVTYRLYRDNQNDRKRMEADADRMAWLFDAYESTRRRREMRQALRVRPIDRMASWRRLRDDASHEKRTD